jgi:hypothetical protein
VCRILFLPTFAWVSSINAAPVLVFLLTFALGASNGLLTNTAFMHASMLAGPERAQTCGNLMVLSLMAGLLVGSLSSYGWLLWAT